MAKYQGFFDTNARTYYRSGGFETKNVMLKAVANGDTKNMDSVLDRYMELLATLFEEGGIEFARESVMFVFAQVSAVATTNGLDDWVAHDMKSEYYYNIEIINSVPKILDLCRKYIESFIRAVHRSKKENFYSPLVSQICQYVHWNVHEKFSIAKIAEEFHFSAGYISHKFKKETGLSVSDYITKAKIAEAKELLRNDMPLIQIAESLNFCTQSHFSKVFREETGMSPGEWKRNLSIT